jgi:hypothetical protein
MWLYDHFEVVLGDKFIIIIIVLLSLSLILILIYNDSSMSDNVGRGGSQDDLKCKKNYTITEPILCHWVLEYCTICRSHITEGSKYKV